MYCRWLLAVFGVSTQGNWRWLHAKWQRRAADLANREAEPDAVCNMHRAAAKAPKAAVAAMSALI